MAALVSLILGVRLRVAGTARLSLIHNNRPEDAPPVWFSVPRLARPGMAPREHIPAAVRRPATLDNLNRLNSFPRLPPGPTNGARAVG